MVCGATPSTERPSKSTWPCVGVYSPVSTLKNVVLPAPFGPIRATIAPDRNVEVDVVDGGQTTELHSYFTGIEQ